MANYTSDAGTKGPSRAAVFWAVALTAVVAVALMLAAAVAPGVDGAVPRIGVLATVLGFAPALALGLGAQLSTRSSPHLAAPAPVIVIGHGSRAVDVVLSGGDVTVRMAGSDEASAPPATAAAALAGPAEG